MVLLRGGKRRYGGDGGRAIQDLWDVGGSLRDFVNGPLGMRDAAVVVEEHVHVLVQKIGVLLVRILTPGMPRVVKGGGAHPALWRAELLQQPRRDEVPGAHSPVLAEIQ